MSESEFQSSDVRLMVYHESFFTGVKQSVYWQSCMIMGLSLCGTRGNMYFVCQSLQG